MGACGSDTPPPSPQPGIKVVTPSTPPVIKVIAIGDSSVGKTTLISRFNRTYGGQDTIGVEYFNTEVTVSGRKVQLQIWDTAGQEKFRAVTASYYRGVDGIFLVYDITSLDSWKRLQEQWLPEVKEKNPTAVRLVVGNKQDWAHQASVSNSHAQRWCHQESLAWIGTSAIEDTKVTEAFHMLVEKILEAKDEAAAAALQQQKK